MSDTRPQSSTSIVERLRFDATRCELHFSKGVASNIEEGIAEIKRLRALLAKEPCPYCTNKFTGLPNNACENCMNTGSKYPEYAEALEGK